MLRQASGGEAGERPRVDQDCLAVELERESTYLTFVRTHRVPGFERDDHVVQRTGGGAAVHDAGWQMMQTGRLFTGGVNTPHIGSVVSYLEGRKTDLPPFVVLPELMGRGGGNLPNGQAGGFLGKAHDPFALNADPSRPGFRVPDLLPPKEISSVRLDRRRKIRTLVDDAVATFEASENAALLDGNFQSAFRLMTSTQARAAFDLAQVGVRDLREIGELSE